MTLSRHNEQKRTRTPDSSLPSEPVQLKDRVEDALNEARTLILGTQVLLGFQYQSAFEPGFPRLGLPQGLASLTALVALLANFALLVLPITSNLLRDRGKDTSREYRLTTNCVAVALPLFALAVGIDIEVALV